jgi:hypothetical protein
MGHAPVLPKKILEERISLGMQVHILGANVSLYRMENRKGVLGMSGKGASRCASFA